VSSTLIRVALLFVFNEAVVNAFSVGMRRMTLRGWRASLCLLAAAVGAVLAPSVADWGSGQSRQPALVIAATALSQGLLWAEVFLLTGVMLDGLRGKSPLWRGLAWHAARGFANGAMFSGVRPHDLERVHGRGGLDAAAGLRERAGVFAPGRPTAGTRRPVAAEG
jgi:hypothetical protein